MAVHQCAQFRVFPMRSHEQAVMRIGCYLLSTCDKGMTYKPDSSKGLEVYVDADFAGGWDPANPGNADYSRTGSVIRYASCPIFWQSKLQTEIALSTAEAKYIALSQALRETIPVMNLMKEINVIFPLIFLNQNLLSRFVNTISLALQWLIIPSFHPRPSILPSSIITYGSM